MWLRHPVTGQMIEVQPGMTREQIKHLAPGGVPEAELAGARGYGVVPLTQRNEDTGRAGGKQGVIPTQRPLQGARPMNRGNTVTLPAKFDPAAGFANGGLAIANSVVETDKDSGDDAELITVVLGIEWSGLAPGDNPPKGILLVQALLTWGIGGVQFQSTIDWQNGCCFNLPASYLRVGASYFSATDIGVVPPDAILTAALAYGNFQQKVGSPRLTQRLAPLGIGASVQVGVPRYATSFTFLPSIILQNPFVQINCRSEATVSAAGSTLAAYFWNGQSNNQSLDESTFPIPNGTKSLILTNNSGSFITDGHGAGVIIFNMSF